MGWERGKGIEKIGIVMRKIQTKPERNKNTRKTQYQSVRCIFAKKVEKN